MVFPNPPVLVTLLSLNWLGSTGQAEGKAMAGPAATKDHGNLDGPSGGRKGRCEWGGSVKDELLLNVLQYHTAESRVAIKILVLL